MRGRPAWALGGRAGGSADPWEAAGGGERGHVLPLLLQPESSQLGVDWGRGQQARAGSPSRMSRVV